MNRTLATIITAAALSVPSVGWSAQSVPYSSDLGYNYILDSEWTQEYGRNTNAWTYDRNSNFTSAGTSGGMMHTFEPEKDADAILLSPAISLTEGTTYTVGFWTRTEGNASSEVEAFKLFMGGERTLSAMKKTTPLIAVDNYNHNDDFERQEVTFTASATEDMYFGIYCCSEYFQGNLCVSGFFIHEGEGGDIPEKPETVVSMPYTADFSTVDGFNEWKSLAGPDAEVTDSWSYNSWSKYPEFDSAYNKKEDNYFISPALDITEAGLYAIDFVYTAYGTFDLVLGTDSSDPASFDRVLFTAEDVTLLSEPAQAAFTVDEPGKYYVAMHVRAEKGSYMGYRLHSFKIKHDLPVPAPVSDLAAIADPDDRLSVELRWTNPSTDHSGNPLDLITGIDIMRDGTLLTAFSGDLTPGTAVSFTDNPAEAGSYSYSVVVRGTNGTFDGEPMTAKAGYVGRPTADFPFDFNINMASEEELLKYTAEDADNNGTTWEIITQYYSTAFTSTNGSTLEDESADNYLASPYIHLVPGYYLFTSSLSSRCNNFEVGITTDRHHIADTFVKYGELNDQQEYGYNDFSVVIPIDEEGDYCLVWRHTGMSTNYAYKTVSLQSASLATQALLPGVVGELTATAPVGVNEVTLTWTNPSLDNAGRELTSLLKAEIRRGEELVGTVTGNLVPGEESTFTDTVSESGEYTYTVTVYNDNGCADAEAPTVTAFVGTGREMPYTADFNEWTIVDKGSWAAWKVNTDGSANFTRGMFDDVEYNDGIYSPYLLLEEGKRYIVTFTTFGTADTSEGEFTMQAGTSRDDAADIVQLSHTGMSDKLHTLRILPLHDVAPLADNGDDIAVPAGNVTVGFHVFQNAEVNIRDFKIEQDPSYSGVISAAAGSSAAALYHDGKVDFAEGVTDLQVTDIAGRVLYYAPKAPASLDLRRIAAKGMLIVRASAPDSTPVTLKVNL